MSNLTDEDFALAGELALGLLDIADTSRANARYAVDGDFAAEVDAWRERLLPMLANVSDQPPADMWDRIRGAIEGSEPAATPANDNGALRMWKGLTALSGAVAAALAVMLFVQPNAVPVNGPVGTPAPVTPANQPILIAALQSETGPASVTANYDPASGELLITPVSMNTGKLYPEIWIIPADGTPRSLGVIAQTGASRSFVKPELRQYMAQGATMAITPEPATGAPGGKPSGAILASGKVTII
jgi:anti-sigma-K factor RskA